VFVIGCDCGVGTQAGHAAGDGGRSGAGGRSRRNGGGCACCQLQALQTAMSWRSLFHSFHSVVS